MKYKVMGLALFILWTVSNLSLYAQAPIKCPGRLSENQITELIKGEVPEARIKQFITECGLALTYDAEVEKRLRSAGASGAILALIKEKAPVPAAAFQPAPESSDTVFWNSIRDSNDKALFEEYLQRFPQGMFRSIVEGKLKGFRVADLRKQIPALIAARQWPKAEEQIKELSSLVPKDEQAKTWARQVAEAIAADRVAAEKAERARASRGEEDRAMREALADFAKDFARIPGGSFTMGCSPGDGDCEKNEKPPHAVQITRGFEMQKHEVTQALWQTVMENNPSGFKGPLLPVELVSWNHVQIFLQKLNQRGDGYRYRLPTEAEWEYAARGGSREARYYGQLDSIAWYSDDSGSQTHRVGEKRPNSFGLYDMLGNVWEWCQDFCDEEYYGKSPAIDPPGPTKGNYRVLRGGCWYNNDRSLRVSLRGWIVPGNRYPNLGFRCVREVKQ